MCSGEVNKEESMYVSLDLEMNQPSRKIIQIGIVYGDMNTGVIWEKQSIYVNPGESLNPYIMKLTGVTEAHIQNAPTLASAYVQIQAAMKRHGPCRNPITWGGGDSEAMRVQMELNENEYLFGRRWLDTKTIFQAWCQSQGKPVQAGLAKAMSKMGLQFKGRKHDALADAMNTFHFYWFMLKKFRP